MQGRERNDQSEEKPASRGVCAPRCPVPPWVCAGSTRGEPGTHRDVLQETVQTELKRVLFWDAHMLQGKCRMYVTSI